LSTNIFSASPVGFFAREASLAEKRRRRGRRRRRRGEEGGNGSGGGPQPGVAAALEGHGERRRRDQERAPGPLDPSRRCPRRRRRGGRVPRGHRGIYEGGSRGGPGASREGDRARRAAGRDRGAIRGSVPLGGEVGEDGRSLSA